MNTIAIVVTIIIGLLCGVIGWLFGSVGAGGYIAASFLNAVLSGSVSQGQRISISEMNRIARQSGITYAVIFAFVGGGISAAAFYFFG